MNRRWALLILERLIVMIFLFSIVRQTHDGFQLWCMIIAIGPLAAILLPWARYGLK